MKRLRRYRALTAVLALGAAGCTGELMAGGQTGEVRTVATDDPAGPAGASPARAPAGATFTRAATAPAQGTVSFLASVELVSERGEVVPVTTGTTGASVRIAASERVPLDHLQVRAQLYPRVRVTFERVAASVEAGVSVGGIALTGDVRVEIGPAQRLVVEAPINLRVEPGSVGTLVVDLNASTWLARADPVTRVVTAADFRSAVEVRVD